METERMDIPQKIHFSLYAVLIAILVLAGYYRASFQDVTDFRLREGDLLLQDLDCGGLCDAIEKVATGYQGASLSHVGIVAKAPEGGLVVIEGVRDGVQATPIQNLLQRSPDIEGRPKVLVGRLEPNLRYLIPSALAEVDSELLLGSLA